ncbi:MAG: hypothetical protein HY081_10180 [Gammaproteobacteria bacterium]|nr:hypothetical protein [Gammaproteobacteria bacterium]
MNALSKKWWIFFGLSFSVGANVIQAQETTANIDEFLASYPKTFVCVALPPYPTLGKTVYVDAALAKEIINRGGYLGPCATYGDKRSIGDGYFQSYVQLDPDGLPWGIGFEFPKSTLNKLPALRHDGLSCFDINGDGKLTIDPAPGVAQECANGHERVLDLPLLAKIAPFKMALVNWQPYGHGPVGVYDVGHFDFHFYIQDIIARNFIRVGPCGLVTNCDDYATARKPVPAQYMHADFVDIGAVATRMGNHLVDTTSGEYHGQPFGESFAFGSYDGKVTFWEPVISKPYLEALPFVCKEIKQPQAYQESGYYPKRYCIRYRAKRQDYTVSLENFVFHQAQ